MQVTYFRGSAVDRNDQILKLDRFLFRPEHISVSWRYYVWNDKGDPILYVERPTNPHWGFIKLVVSLAAGVGAFLGAAMILPEGILAPYRLFLLLVPFLVAVLITYAALGGKYNATFFRDESRGEVYLRVVQENWVPIPFAWYSIQDGSGRTLGRIRRNLYHYLVLKNWRLYGTDGSILCFTREDSLARSFLSRLIGSPTPLLRTNYTLIHGKTGNIIGEFNRRKLIFGCYVLDMSDDYHRSIDRRVALGLSVLLDVGEKA
jgi:hypothetical protein